MNIHDYQLFHQGFRVPFEANSAYYDLRDDVPFLHLDAFRLWVTSIAGWSEGWLVAITGCVKI
jgi:hypothetical protein